ncbi:MAG: hypothetical protein JXA33_28020 [Anaerolineae bacterium]|nr:hypothetical protein [Anaerolineae bacterium]
MDDTFDPVQWITTQEAAELTGIQRAIFTKRSVEAYSQEKGLGWNNPPSLCSQYA